MIAPHVSPPAAPRRRSVLTSRAAAVVLVLLAACAVWSLTGPIRRERMLARASLPQLEQMARSPQNGRVFYYLGQRLREKGRMESACEAFARAAQLSPDDADIWLAAADSAAIVYGDQGAFDLLTRFLQRQPGDTRVRLALAELYLTHRAYQRADEEAKTVLRADPQRAQAWRIAGIAATIRTPRDAEPALRRAVALAPRDWRNPLSLGDLLTGQQRPDEAISFCRAAVRLAPQEPVAHLSLGRALLNVSVRTPALRDEAREELRHSLALRPDIPVTYLLLGQSYAQEGRWAEARPLLEQARRRAPSSVEPAFDLAHAYARLGLKKEAAQEAARHRRLVAYQSKKRTLQEEIAAGGPDVLTRRLQLARLMAANGDTSEALVQYRQALADGGGDARARREWQQLKTRAAPPTQALADSLLAQGQYEASVQVAMRLIQQNPGDAQAMQAAGLALSRTGKDALAVPFLLEATRRNPLLPQAQLVLSRIYREWGFRDEAARRARLILRVDGSSAAAWHELGLILRDGDLSHQQAEDAFARAAALAPQQPAFWLDMGEMQAANARPAEAERAFRQALQLAPQDPDVLARSGAFLANAMQGESAAQAEARRQEARRLLQAALAADPTDSFVRFHLGRLALEAGDAAAAARHLEAAVRDKDASNPADVWYTLSRAYRQQGQIQRAMAAVEQSRHLRSRYVAAVTIAEQATQNPGDPRLRLQLARAYAERGQWAWAIRTYQECLSLMPDPTPAPRELQALQQRLTQAGQMPSMPLFYALLAASQRSSEGKSG